MGCTRWQVNELAAANEYALRMREVAFNEKLRATGEQAASEAETHRVNFEQLMVQKSHMKLEYEDQIKRMHEVQQVRLYINGD